MKKSVKLSVLLAVTDTLAVPFKNMIQDFNKFFKNSQGAFIGGKKTYEPKEGTVDEPTKRGNSYVQTTVKEKLDWFRDQAKEYIDSLFSQEKTNAIGAYAELEVEGKSWGKLTSLELLRLKSVVSTAGLETLLSSIPVRSDAEEWKPTQNEMYKDREIFESPLVTGVNITTEKESYILKDPNVAASGGTNYVPQVAVKTSIVELGDTTMQKFSGEWSQRQRAEALKRRTVLLTAITKALKECNEVEVVQSTVTSDKIFGYLFGN